MSQDWNSYEKAAEKGPVAIGWKIFGFITGATLILATWGTAYLLHGILF